MDSTAIDTKLLDIYHRLMEHYGPQHWWPAKDPFEVMVGAILTQSAAWSNVEKAINKLRTANALSPQAIRNLSVDELAILVHSSGYYNVKAQKLKSLVYWLGNHYHDNLDDMFASDTALLRQQLLSVRGIGQETADSIILYAANKPIFVIDAYTRRIISRFGIAPKTNSYAAYQSFFMENLPADAILFNEYHALLVQLAKDACQKRPTCQRCCLDESCLHLT